MEEQVDKGLVPRARPGLSLEGCSESAASHTMENDYVSHHKSPSTSPQHGFGWGEVRAVPSDAHPRERQPQQRIQNQF